MCSRNWKKIKRKILNESNYFQPNIGNKFYQKNKSQNKIEMLDSLALEINTISEKSISERKQILNN